MNQYIRVSKAKLENVLSLIKEMKDDIEITSEIFVDLSLLEERVQELFFQPVQTVFDRLPRDIRAFSKDNYKNVSFHHLNGHIEIHKELLDYLNEILLFSSRHIIKYGIKSNSDLLLKCEEKKPVIRFIYKGKSFPIHENLQNVVNLVNGKISFQEQEHGKMSLSFTFEEKYFLREN